MAFIPAPNIVMAEILATKDSQKIENRFMVDVLTTPSPTIVENVANIVNVWAQDFYFDHLPNSITLRGVQATDMSTQNGSQVLITPTGPFAGALAGPHMPNEVTFCLQLKTASRGRSARGRTYVLGVSRSDVTGENTFWDVRATDLVNDFTELKSRITTAGWQWVVVSYRNNKVVRPGGPVYFPIESVGYNDLIVDSMRRRKPGIGQ